MQQQRKGSSSSFLHLFYSSYQDSQLWKLRMILLLLFLWDSHQLFSNTHPMGVLCSHRPKGPLYQPSHPMYFSSFYPKLWNMNLSKSPPSQKTFVHDASEYFNPFRSLENPENEAGSAEGGLPRAKTMTPFIGARALSNMGKFFEDLQANLEILKENYDKNPGGDTENNGEEPGVTMKGNNYNGRRKELMINSIGSNEVVKSSLNGKPRWVNPAASFFRGKHRFY